MIAQPERCWVRVLRPFYLSANRIAKTGERVEVSRELLGQLLLANRAMVINAPAEGEHTDGDA